MLALDPANGAAGGAHHDAFGRHAAAGAALDAFEQRAVGDAGRREDRVALHQIVEMIDPVEIGHAPFAGAGAFIFVAEDENAKILSAMFVYLIPTIPTPNAKREFIAYLTKVFTLEEYRGKGIGTRLLDYVKNYLSSINCELVFAWPSENSAEWYKSHGFSDTNEIFECRL